MTGEIDLRGNITKIGGLSSKITGAIKAGIKTILIPRDNKEDLDLCYKDNIVDEGIDIILVDTIFDILKYGLIENDINFNKMI